MAVLKKRDIPSKSTRPLAYANFANSLGPYRAGQRVMAELGRFYTEGKDYFGTTKHVHYFKRLLKSLDNVGDALIKRDIAVTFRKITIERINSCLCPDDIKIGLRSVVATCHKEFKRKINLNGTAE